MKKRLGSRVGLIGMALAASLSLSACDFNYEVKVNDEIVKSSDKDAIGKKDKDTKKDNKKSSKKEKETEEEIEELEEEEIEEEIEEDEELEETEEETEEEEEAAWGQYEQFKAKLPAGFRYTGHMDRISVFKDVKDKNNQGDYIVFGIDFGDFGEALNFDELEDEELDLMCEEMKNSYEETDTMKCNDARVIRANGHKYITFDLTELDSKNAGQDCCAAFGLYKGNMVVLIGVYPDGGTNLNRVEAFLSNFEYNGEACESKLDIELTEDDLKEFEGSVENIAGGLPEEKDTYSEEKETEKVVEETKEYKKDSSTDDRVSHVNEKLSISLDSNDTIVVNGTSFKFGKFKSDDIVDALYAGGISEADLGTLKFVNLEKDGLIGEYTSNGVEICSYGESDLVKYVTFKYDSNDSKNFYVLDDFEPSDTKETVKKRLGTPDRGYDDDIWYYEDEAMTLTISFWDEEDGGSIMSVSLEWDKFK